ncbi:MAG: phage tail protein [Synechococcus sp.]
MPPYPEILTTSRFYIELKLDGSTDSIDAVFKECSGFQRSQDAIEMCEVTPQLWGKRGKTPGRFVRTKLPGNASVSNLTLKRGLTVSETLWNWMQAVEDGDWAEQRRDGAVVVYDQSSTEKFRFEFERAWPVSYSISDLDVTSGDHNIEQLEIAVENLKRVEARRQ